MMLMSMPTEQRKKIGAANSKPKPSLRGNKHAAGHAPWNKGMRGVFNGEKNANWKGGTRYYRIFRRDDFTCQMCGLRDPDVMEIDHKIPRVIRPDLHKDDNNLWTLCANDHRRKTKRDWQLIKEFRADRSQ